MGFYDLVLHVDMADSAIMKMAFRNANNYLNALPNESFVLSIVANGGAATLLVSANAELHNLALPVLAKGVLLKVCANALAENGIMHDEVWPEAEIVPAGLVEVVRLQRAGFAYIKP